MLAELQGERASTEEPKETNGAAEAEKPADETEKPVDETSAEKKAEGKQRDDDTSREHRHHGRSDRGGGRGRGRGGQNNQAPRNYRDNIKSDLTTQEESNGPVAIRKQVRAL